MLEWIFNLGSFGTNNLKIKGGQTGALLRPDYSRGDALQTDAVHTTL